MPNESQQAESDNRDNITQSWRTGELKVGCEEELGETFFQSKSNRD